ncbi:MAG: GspH/FimT family pseudopilin [Marinicellaceae bacterium]
MNTTKGYSLIELVITLAIASILISYALPSLHDFRSNKILKNERDRLMVSFAFARTQAVTQENQVVVCPSNSGMSCDAQSNWHKGWIIFEDTNRNRQFDNNENLLQFENQMDESVEALSSLYRSKIRFNNMGFSPGTNVSINFCDKRGMDFAQSLIINNAGRIKQSKPISANICT